MFKIVEFDSLDDLAQFMKKFADERISRAMDYQEDFQARTGLEISPEHAFNLNECIETGIQEVRELVTLVELRKKEPWAFKCNRYYEKEN